MGPVSSLAPPVSRPPVGAEACALRSVALRSAGRLEKRRFLVALPATLPQVGERIDVDPAAISISRSAGSCEVHVTDTPAWESPRRSQSSAAKRIAPGLKSEA